jgi:hypothetical protein
MAPSLITIAIWLTVLSVMLAERRSLTLTANAPDYICMNTVSAR